MMSWHIAAQSKHLGFDAEMSKFCLMFMPAAQPEPLQWAMWSARLPLCQSAVVYTPKRTHHHSNRQAA